MFRREEVFLSYLLISSLILIQCSERDEAHTSGNPGKMPNLRSENVLTLGRSSGVQLMFRCFMGFFLNSLYSRTALCCLC